MNAMLECILTCIVVSSFISLHAIMMCVANVCGLPPIVGDCDAAFLRYFFNRTSQRCEMFIWGGCGGNGNRFISGEDCRTACGGRC